MPSLSWPRTLVRRRRFPQVMAAGRQHAERLCTAASPANHAPTIPHRRTLLRRCWSPRPDACTHIVKLGRDGRC
ncbi:hypothetical protein PVAP13_7KG097400 [Panicum virgatum]|uniref:Uncharacterized protein n=1 Tax=Panicum virgatum TaxID=38727 RepID=A0A8T0QB49_PANVG|nr:hypothetical protein PVAP13_7KG097400 [Panicum virgatum]